MASPSVLPMSVPPTTSVTVATETDDPSAVSTLSTTSDVLWKQLHQEALETLKEEPELCALLKRTILAPGVDSFETAIAHTICFRLLQQHSSGTPMDNANNCMCPVSLTQSILSALQDNDNSSLELGHSMIEAVRLDLLAVVDRDPACETLLEVVLFMKGFAALVCHRVAHWKWIHRKQRKRSFVALFVQSQASAAFGVDIHPGAQMGAGILLDHGTGIVIGETAIVEDGCTLLHGVTLGGTGKEIGDRHPKVRANVLIGANTSILGNIDIGRASKIGAGSVVLKSIPPGATAVGAPAKIIGRAQESNPASTMDENLDQVSYLHHTRKLLHKSSSETSTTAMMDSMTATTTTSHSSNNSHSDDGSSNSAKDDQDKAQDRDLPGSTDDKTSKVQAANVKPPKQVTIQHRHAHSKNKKHLSKQRESFYNFEPPPGSVCPFREYQRMGREAPAGTITYCRLTKRLKGYGYTSHQIGCIFFALDTENVGYIEWDAFAQRFGEVLESSPSPFPPGSTSAITTAQVSKEVLQALAPH